MTLPRRVFLGISLPLASAAAEAALGAHRLFAAAVAPDGVPDAVFYGGKVLTVDREFGVAEAFAIRNGRFVAVGTSDAILRLAGPTTVQHHLRGRCVMPGIVDSHAHPIAAAMYELDHEIPSMASLADVLDYFRARTRIVPTGSWIGLQQVFITRLQDKRYPTRTELDAAVPEHPAFMRTGPDAMLNSRALAVFGVTRESGDHAGSGLGRIERDPHTNEPTGMMRNCTAVGSFLVPDTQAGSKRPQQQLQKLFAAYNSVGITTVADRNATPDDIALYQTLSETGALTCRVHIYHAVSAKLTPAEIAAHVEHVGREVAPKRSDFCRIGGVKMFLDGGMLTGSARMRQPWGPSPIYKITDPDYHGLLLISDEQLVQFLKSAAEHDLQPAVHCVGDGALSTLLAAMATADRALPSGTLRRVRPGICHGNFMYPEAFETMVRLGAVVDMQPVWLYLDGATLRDHFGDERLTWFQPYRTLYDKKVPIGGGSDHMLKIHPNRAINLYNPFLGISTMLTRTARGADTPIHPEQRITRMEAIRFYTIESAYILRSEADRGSIEPGKFADFIVLDRDITACPLNEIGDIHVEETWVGGTAVGP